MFAAQDVAVLCGGFVWLVRFCFPPPVYLVWVIQVCFLGVVWF